MENIELKLDDFCELKEDITEEIEDDSISQFSYMDYPCLGQEEQKRLLIKYHESKDPEILKKLTLGNIRLVKSIVITFLHRGMEFEDLMQEGIEALIIGIQKFDPQTGNCLSTYVKPAIIRHLIRALEDQSKHHRIPKNMYTKLGKYLRIKEENGLKSYDEIAAFFHMSKKRVEEYERLLGEPVSTSKQLDAENDIVLEDTLSVDNVNFYGNNHHTSEFQSLEEHYIIRITL